MKKMKQYNLKSLALITDLISAEFETEVIERDQYLVFKTPSHPDYFWGNFICFHQAPIDGDLKLWKEICDKEYAIDVPCFYTFTWDSEEAEMTFIEPFKEDGFKFGIDVTLATESPVKPPSFSEKVEVRVLETIKDWDMIPGVHAVRKSKKSLKSQAGFLTKRLVAFRELCDRGSALRFGAFIDGKLVGDLGICYQDGIARYNLVATHEDFRGQGICQTLVYLSARYVLEHHNISKLVIVADEDYHAQKVYQKVGFKLVQKNYSLTWWDEAIYGETP